MANNNTPPSRLSLSGDVFRNTLIPRNLYNLDNEYEVTGTLSLRNKSKVADSIASILSVIPQWQKVNPENSLLSRVVENQTPLAQIGTVMLAQQLFYNSVSHIAQQNLPSIDLGQALKGKSPFIKNVDYSITDKKDENKSGFDKVGGFISKTYFNTNALGTPNPFREDSTNAEIIQNTGKGQLTRFYEAINMNIYKQIGGDESSKTLVEYAALAKTSISDRNSTIQSRVNITRNPTRIYFDFDKNPYWRYTLSKYAGTAVERANFDVTLGYVASTKSNTQQEYASSQKFIEENFGVTTVLNQKDDMFNYVGEISNLDQDTVIKNKLVWGRDGVGQEANDVLSALHGNTDDEKKNLGVGDFTTFKVTTGLLEYTRNLLNATEGNFVDITRKVFKEGTKVIGFNGSPLWKANDSTYSRANGIEGKTGVRQHSMLDQYDRFAKTIRFKGNVVYGGNPNSVIHQTVIPRIHPTLDANDGKPNPKNMMFSLENLALNVIKRDNYAVIDDEWGTAIPLSEAGPFNGRIMWFPPYDLQLSEVAMAKYESTVMVGRNEPMYNYMNSERTVTLAFTLLIDYPEQLRNYISTSNDKNKTIADFFAFGGDPLPPEQVIEEYVKEIERLQGGIPEITGPVLQAEPPKIDVPPMTIYFPNDMPVEGEEPTIIDKMYKDPLHYEIIKGCESAQDGNGWGLNESIYYRTGLTETSVGVYVLTNDDFSQYSQSGVSDQIGICLLNKQLRDVYANEENRKYYSITIEGGASKLYLNKNEAKYNKDLGQRRIKAARKLVESRLKAIFPSIDLKDVEIIERESTGSIGSSAEGALAKNMALKNVKEERRARITIARNNKKVEDKVQQVNQDQKKDVENIRKEISTLEEKVVRLKNVISDNLLNERKKASLLGYEAVTGNYYYPAFHSQTPEDFHRRLTFLQQCVRQGAAKRYDIVDKDTNELRARNSVFGRQPICVLRVGDFFYTKVVIDNVTVDYNETTWDMNPEGFGMQPMIAKVTLQMKVIGGQSLKGPIDALQNAVSFNYYANSTFTGAGMYARPSSVADAQDSYMNGVDGKGGILGENRKTLNAAYEKTAIFKTREGGE